MAAEPWAPMITPCPKLASVFYGATISICVTNSSSRSAGLCRSSHGDLVTRPLSHRSRAGDTALRARSGTLDDAALLRHKVLLMQVDCDSRGHSLQTIRS